MRTRDEEDKELRRWRQKANYFKKQCAHLQEETRKLLARKQELEAQRKQNRKRLKELQAVEAQLKRSVEYLEILLQKQQVPGRDSSDSAQRDDAPAGGRDVSKD